MHERQLADAIDRLTAHLHHESEERKKDLVTKTVLRATEQRILTAIGAASSGIPAAEIAKLISDLKGSTDALQAGVEANPPSPP